MTVWKLCNFIWGGGALPALIGFPRLIYAHAWSRASASSQLKGGRPHLTPIPAQVVFQGGGAKLCSLMAVCEALEELEQQHRLEIKCAAGSSAGAIAAAMLASKTSIKDFKTRLLHIAPRYLPAFRVANWKGAWRVYNGGPYFTDMDLEKFFDELLCTRDNIRLVNDLRLETLIYFTDLYSLSSTAAASSEALPKALSKSCRFPFALVGYKTGNTDVDGGLASNLPVDDLRKQESTKGSVFAVSFKAGFGTASSNSLLAYTQQLFSAAIQSGVTRSELLLGKLNVFSADTPIGTFEFEQALADGFGQSYDTTKEKFSDWIEGWLSRHGGDTTGRRLIRPPLSNSPLPQPIMRELDRTLMSDRTHAQRMVSYDVALLDSNGSFSGKYRSINSMRFTARVPISALQYDVGIEQVSHDQNAFDSANLGCFVVDKDGNPVRFSCDVQELPRRDEKFFRYRVYILFEQELIPGSSQEPYMLRIEYITNDVYPNLDKADYLLVSRTQGDADEVKVGAAFPRSKFWKRAPVVTDLAKCTPAQLEAAKYSNGSELIASDQLDIHEFADELSLEEAWDKYVIVGRRARNVRLGQGLGFAIEP